MAAIAAEAARAAVEDRLYHARLILAQHGYTFGRELGCGSYSTVRLVQKDGISYACKIVSTDMTSLEYRTKFLPRELKILSRIRHCHITEVYQIIQLPRRVFIIMELAAGGDLLEKVQRERRLYERKAHELFVQLACALAYLHRHDVAHRDLKCENVLLTSDGVVKLTDFSFSRFCVDPHTKQNVLSRTFCGSEAYAAPEILQGISYLPKMEDMWSLGVILYIMLTGALPFEEGNIHRQIRLQMTRMVRFPRALPISHSVKNLVRFLLEPVVTLRATMGAVVHHPWIKMYPNPLKMLEERYAYSVPTALAPYHQGQVMQEIQPCSHEEDACFISPVPQRGKENLFQSVVCEGQQDEYVPVYSAQQGQTPVAWSYQPQEVIPTSQPILMQQPIQPIYQSENVSRADTDTRRWQPTETQAQYLEEPGADHDDMRAIFDNLKTEMVTERRYSDEEPQVIAVSLEQPLETPERTVYVGRHAATPSYVTSEEGVMTPPNGGTQAGAGSGYLSGNDVVQNMRYGNDDERYSSAFAQITPNQGYSMLSNLTPTKSPSQYQGRSQSQYQSKSPSQYPSKSPTQYQGKSPSQYESRSQSQYQSRSPSQYQSKTPSRYQSKFLNETQETEAGRSMITDVGQSFMDYSEDVKGSNSSTKRRLSKRRLSKRKLCCVECGEVSTHGSLLVLIVKGFAVAGLTEGSDCPGCGRRGGGVMADEEDDGVEDPQEAAKSEASLALHGYTTGKVLGSGSYSTVRLVMKNGVTYACKIISKEKSSPIYRTKFLPRELKILGSMKHPHIARVDTIIEEPAKVFIMMELATGGDLLEKIQKVRRLDEKHTHVYFMQLASALAYLHKNDVAHRDLKCENVLLTSADVVKLTDFSFSRYCTNPDNKMKELSSTFCGSEAYAAPEILQGIRYLPKQEDVWSLGVILYVMVTGLLPFESGSLLRQLRLQMTRSVRFPKPLPLSRELKNLIRAMLEPVIMLRANMARVIRHPWIKMYPSPFKEIHERVARYQKQAALAAAQAAAVPPAPAPLPKPKAQPKGEPQGEPREQSQMESKLESKLESKQESAVEAQEEPALVTSKPVEDQEPAAEDGATADGGKDEGAPGSKDVSKMSDDGKKKGDAQPDPMKEDNKSRSSAGSAGSDDSDRSVKKMAAQEHIPTVVLPEKGKDQTKTAADGGEEDKKKNGTKEDNQKSGDTSELGAKKGNQVDEGPGKDASKQGPNDDGIAGKAGEKDASRLSTKDGSKDSRSGSDALKQGTKNGVTADNKEKENGRDASKLTTSGGPKAVSDVKDASKLSAMDDNKEKGGEKDTSNLSSKVDTKVGKTGEKDTSNQSSKINAKVEKPGEKDTSNQSSKINAKVEKPGEKDTSNQSSKINTKVVKPGEKDTSNQSSKMNTKVVKPGEKDTSNQSSKINTKVEKPGEKDSSKLSTKIKTKTEITDREKDASNLSTKEASKLSTKNSNLSTANSNLPPGQAAGVAPK
ncbi:uncharacterized protein LOC135369725 [Ornithodoros turicata]|uniref:uncharacterized protein LOC135369725 n=1 Tax=Ornithodoros turicata TaxID=34597 RepID=UPI003139BEF0